MAPQMTDIKPCIAGATGRTGSAIADAEPARSAAPYLTGVLLAVRRARAHVGLIRGPDRLLLARRHLDLPLNARAVEPAQWAIPEGGAGPAIG